MNEGNWLFVLFFSLKKTNKQTNKPLTRKEETDPRDFFIRATPFFFRGLNEKTSATRRAYISSDVLFELSAWFTASQGENTAGYVNDSLSSRSLSLPNSAFHCYCPAIVLIIRSFVLPRPRLLKFSNPRRRRKRWLSKTKDLMAHELSRCILKLCIFLHHNSVKK